MNKETAKEMAKELCCYYDKRKRKCTNCFGMEDDCDLHCNFGRTLERLSNAGYQKVDKDSVVLSREEYKELYNAERASYYNAELLAVDNDLLHRKLTDTRKEIVKEILETVKELYTTPYSCFLENILKIAKQFEVDLEQSTKCKYFQEIDYGYRQSKQCYAQKGAPEVTCNGHMSDCSKYPKITTEVE